MADPKTRLYVAEYAGKAVGLSIMLPITTNEWWFQGFRIDPQQQGKQIGSSLMAYAMDTWYEIGSGVVRLTTNANQLKVQHLCEKHGFIKMAERALYAAPALPEVPGEKFTLLTPDEIPEAAVVAAVSQIAAAQANLVELSWRYARPSLAAFQELVSWPDGRLYWWGNKRGLLAIWDDADNEQAGIIPMLAYIACQQQDLPALLMDFRRLGGQQGAKWVGGRIVLGDLAPALDQAGFAIDDTDIDFIYEKPHPTRP